MSAEGLISPKTFRDAVRVWLDIAYPAPARAPKLPPGLLEATTTEEILKTFVRDQRAGVMRRYLLRLGNHRYPHMKLAFQELLVRDRFFFAVDTHDSIDIQSHFEDYEKWLDLRRYNQDVRSEIETRWRAEGVPTFSDLVAWVEKETPPGPGARLTEKAARILVVDDEVRIGDAVAGILGRQGYRVMRADSAERALQLLDANEFDLILSDLEMGGMTGLELAAKVKAKPNLAQLPFILATAAAHVDRERLPPEVDAFLVKPYETAVLLKFVSSLLPATHHPSPGGEELS